MIQILPDGTVPAEHSVDRPSHSDRDAPESALERVRVVGLDDQMQVIVLHTELKNPETAVGSRGESTSDGRKDPPGPQATDHTSRAQGNV